MRGWTWQGGKPRSAYLHHLFKRHRNSIKHHYSSPSSVSGPQSLNLLDAQLSISPTQMSPTCISSQQYEWLYSLRRSKCFYLLNKIFSYSFISICLSCVTFTFLTSSLLVSEATLVYIVRNIGQQLESYRTAYFKGLPRLTNRSDLNLFYMHRQILKFSFQQNYFHLYLKFCLQVVSVSARQLLMQHC